jgi:hypothetical protein
MSDDGDDEENVFGYQSGDDDEILDDKKEIVVPRKSRGQGKIWEVRKVHASLAIAKESIQSHNRPVVKRLTGRVTRGKTLAFYYRCMKRSCGCTKEWRLVTALDSHLVTEEESTGDHINHDKEERNGGRGLSFDQVKIVDDAFAINVKRPLQVVEYFIKTVKDQQEAGMYLIVF